VPIGVRLRGCSSMRRGTSSGATIIFRRSLPEDLNPLILLFVVMPITSLVVLGARHDPRCSSWRFWPWHREQKRDPDVLAGTRVERGTLTRQEYEVLPSKRRRLRTEYGMLRHKGLRAFFAIRGLPSGGDGACLQEVARGVAARTPKRAPAPHPRRPVPRPDRDSCALRFRLIPRQS